ncbi:hypothetical protein [Rathayibacter agropyri]|uniref:hypothetical protein n=1 Tax=Rathayibacter agropyri TaxID=1634927 RepID=UPI001563F1A6|nr:hypothetical protein [Rathayibacter agropyri]NRD08894.1 hypothetical protein [Rathayibacter agropyri]
MTCPSTIAFEARSVSRTPGAGRRRWRSGPGSIGRSGARSGLPSGITTVRGLLLGTAGALYALCREIDPALPNVLLLE